MQRYIPLLGRVLLALIFLVSGINKITGFSGQVAYAESAGVPMATAAIVAAIVFELGGALMLILGWKARWGAAALIVYTILATLFFHLDLADQMQQIQLMKNLAIVGGLLFVTAFGTGGCALESDTRTEHART